MRHALFAAFVLGATISCSASAPEPTYPGQLVAPREYGPDFMAHQQLAFQRGDYEGHFQVALQHSGESITLVGLTPMGTRAFVIEQRGVDVELTSHLPEGKALPFPARFILLDIQKTFVPPPQSKTDGEQRFERAGEAVSERWQGGKLQERRFERLDGTPPGHIVITYGDGGYDFQSEPGTIHLENQWMGYSIDITTLSYQFL